MVLAGSGARRRGFCIQFCITTRVTTKVTLGVLALASGVYTYLGVRDLLAGPAPVEREAPRIPARPSRVADGGEVITEELLLQTLADLRPDGSVIVEEAPATRSAMHDHLPIDRPHGFFTCASGGLGHGLPASIGVAMARSTDARVIALVGDGSSMYTIQALWSAAQLGVDLTVVVVDNGRYRALDQFAEHFGVDKPVGTALPGLDFVALAAGQGVPGTRVTRPAELPDALTEALRSTGPVLVDVVIGERTP